MVGICTSGGIITADASKRGKKTSCNSAVIREGLNESHYLLFYSFAKSATLVPNLQEARQDPLMAKLKSHLEGVRP